MAKPYDIAIIGTDPAALAAGIALADHGLHVKIVEVKQDSGTECPLCDWIPAEFFTLPALPDSLASLCHAQPFDQIVYHDAQLKHSVKDTAATPMGYFLPPHNLNDALRSIAKEKKVTFTRTDQLPSFDLHEESVTVNLPNASFQAGLLLVTTGPAIEAESAANLAQAQSLTQIMTATALDIPLAAAQKDTVSPAMHLVELQDQHQLGMFFSTHKALHVRLITRRQEKLSGVAHELSSLLNRLQAAQILPGKLSVGKAVGATWQPQAMVAMEMQTHVAKRCLLAGAAGGFADSVTGQTLFPAVSSGLLAAETLFDASRAQNPQEILCKFNDIWENKLGEYLSLPSVPLATMLPLGLANPSILPRLAGSFLRGSRM